MQEMRKALSLMADDSYKRFHCRLIPTVDPACVLGVRTPALRAFAKRLTPVQRETVLSSLPHELYEENNLHAFVIEQIPDFDECIRQAERFLPFVDNWATCDMMRPRVFEKHKPELFEKCFEWMASPHEFAVRYGLEMLMVHGLDDAFDPLFLQRAAAVRSEHYYVNMMTAWFFATALTKRYEDALPYLQNDALDVWVHNKAIQKARESCCIDADRKQYLNTLKRKG